MNGCECTNQNCCQCSHSFLVTKPLSKKVLVLVMYKYLVQVQRITSPKHWYLYCTIQYLVLVQVLEPVHEIAPVLEYKYFVLVS